MGSQTNDHAKECLQCNCVTETNRYVTIKLNGNFISVKYGDKVEDKLVACIVYQ